MYQRFPADGQLLLYVPSQSLLMYMAKSPLTLPGKGHLPGQDWRWTRIQGWHPNLLLLAFKNWHNEITELLTLKQHICTVWTEKKWKRSTTLLPRKNMLVHPTGSYFYLVILLIWEMKLCSPQMARVEEKKYSLSKNPSESHSLNSM